MEDHRNNSGWPGWVEVDGSRKQGRETIVPEEYLQLSLDRNDFERWHIRGAMYRMHLLALDLAAMHFGGDLETEEQLKLRHPGYLYAFIGVVSSVGHMIDDWIINNDNEREIKPSDGYMKSEVRQEAVLEMAAREKNEESFKRWQELTLSANEALTEHVARGASSVYELNEGTQEEFDLGVVHALWACRNVLSQVVDSSKLPPDDGKLN